MGNCFRSQKPASLALPNDLEIREMQYGFESDESGEMNELLTEGKPMPTPLRCPNKEVDNNSDSLNCRNCYAPLKSPMLPNDLEMHDVEYGFEPDQSGDIDELITEVRPMPTPLRCPDLITPDRKIETLFSKNGRPKSNEYVRQYITNKRLSNSGNSSGFSRATISPEQALLCQFDECE